MRDWIKILALSILTQLVVIGCVFLIFHGLPGYGEIFEYLPRIVLLLLLVFVVPYLISLKIGSYLIAKGCNRDPQFQKEYYKNILMLFPLTALLLTGILAILLCFIGPKVL